jgi:hypothetical protein
MQISSPFMWLFLVFMGSTPHHYSGEDQLANGSASLQIIHLPYNPFARYNPHIIHCQIHPIYVRSRSFNHPHITLKLYPCGAQPTTPYMCIQYTRIIRSSTDKYSMQTFIDGEMVLRSYPNQ